MSAKELHKYLVHISICIFPYYNIHITCHCDRILHLHYIFFDS